MLRRILNRALVPGLLLAGFVGLQCLLPLRSAIKLGADEDFEYAKVTLWLKGYHFYTDIWCDQPLLHTFWITRVLKHVSPSVLGPRLVTSAFTVLLLASVFSLTRRVRGLGVAALTTALLITSPGFLELGSSSMMEIPSLAPALAALAVLVVGSQSRYCLTEVVAGVLFAVALQSKFIGVIYLPLVGLALWRRCAMPGPPLASFTTHHSSFVIPEAPHPGPSDEPGCSGASAERRHHDRWKFAALYRVAATVPGITSGAVFGLSLLAAFVAIHLMVGEAGFWLQLKQSWASHFAAVRSFEYGAPSDRPFDWSILVKNWDTTVPALVGLVGLIRQAIWRPSWAWLPLAWVALTLVVFSRHKPWWSYYYVHNAIPLCWCAAVGWVSVGQRPRQRRSRGLLIVCVAIAIGAAAWAGARVYLQVQSMRALPRLHSGLVLREIERDRPFTKFFYAEDPIYTFHAGIPMPPWLAVAALKRFWSGDLTNTRLVEELQRVRPGVILLGNDARERPFQDWLQREYRLVYEDAKHRLYALRSVIDQAER
jgi:hypothetical protein